MADQISRMTDPEQIDARLYDIRAMDGVSDKTIRRCVEAGEARKKELALRMGYV